MKKIKNFVYALIQHIYFGMKKSSQEEIEKRFSVCMGCEMVHPNKTECLECGCYISQQKKFLNKLAWQDQKCPIGKW